MNLTFTHRRALALTAGILFAALTGWGFSSRAPGGTGSATASPQPVSIAAGADVQVSGVSTAASSRAALPPPNSLLTRYNAGDNVRALVDYALQHPEQGGHFYASRLLTQCRGLTHGTEVLANPQTPYAGQADYAERSDAASRLSRRCAGLLPDELDFNRDRQIVAQGVAKGDPLVIAAEEYSKATQGFAESEARRAAMSRVLATQDPLLIEDLGMRLSMYVDASGRKYFWFAGRSYALDSDVDVGAAFYLLPCGLGMECDKTEFTTAVRCASGEGCENSRYDYVRRTYQTRAGAYEKIIALHAAMVDAVKSRNVDVFVR